MTKDKKVLYTVSLTIFAFLLAILLIDVSYSRVITACILLPLTFLSLIAIRKRGALSINKREVLLLSAVVGALYVILVQLSGLFFEYYLNPYLVDTKGFFTIVLPIAAIIICSEIIRRVLLAQKNLFASFLAYPICVIAEVLTYSNLAGITNFNRFMNLFGMVLFPAICANIYYHYASKKYGAVPNIVFRLIITLYTYLFPSVSGISDALLSCSKMILPLLMLWLVSAMFEKTKKRAQRGSKLSIVGLALGLVIAISLTMLISCQFRYGAIVVATESMTGEINKGDVIIYEQYEKQRIKEGQVIVFRDNNRRIIHRVVRIDSSDGEARYYTKGDANEHEDSGYRTKEDIIGLTDIKVSYVGYPTLWLRELLQSSN